MTDICVGGESCEGSKPGRPTCSAGILGEDGNVDPASQHFDFHCDHWYEDMGCCYCDITTINLLVFGDEDE